VFILTLLQSRAQSDRAPVEALKDQLAWVVVPKIDEWEDDVERLLRQYSQAVLQSLTSYPYFVQAVNALYS
jgi:hypothetical protein